MSTLQELIKKKDKLYRSDNAMKPIDAEVERYMLLIIQEKISESKVSSIKSDEKCRKCKTAGIIRKQVQVRAGDEGEETQILCPSCGEVYRENALKAVMRVWRN